MINLMGGGELLLLEKDYKSFLIHLFFVIGIYNGFKELLQQFKLLLDGRIIINNTDYLILLIITAFIYSKFKKYIKIN